MDANSKSDVLLASHDPYRVYFQKHIQRLKFNAHEITMNNR